MPPLTSASVDDFNLNILYQTDAGRQAMQMGLGRLSEVISKEVLASSIAPDWTTLFYDHDSLLKPKIRNTRILTLMQTFFVK